jgi:hypothetical protein
VQGGGSIRAFVLLPAQGRLAVVDVDSRSLLRTVQVPRGKGPVATSIDGSRVLVANTRLGTVTQIDGRTYRRVHTFNGLGRPVDLVLLPRVEVGLVRPRYAAVADARGSIDILDLGTGRILRRVVIPHPRLLALSDPQLWVSSAGRSTLTLLDVGSPATTHITARANATVVPTALAPDPTHFAVDVSSRRGAVIRVEAVSLAHSVVRFLGGRVTQLLPGYQGVVWAAEADGRVLGVRMSSGRIISVMNVPPHSRLAVVAGWLAAVHGRALLMSVLGRPHVQVKRVRLPGSGGAFSFAVK